MEAVSNMRNSAVGAREAVKNRSNSAEDRETVNNSRNRARGAREAGNNRSNSIRGSWMLLTAGARASEGPEGCFKQEQQH